MLMITPSLDVKSTLSPVVQKSLAITQLFLQQLCALCVYGIGFLCLIIWGSYHIAAKSDICAIK